MDSKLQQAIDLATKYHQWQIRKDWTKYIEHPIAVMELLNKYNFPEDALIAAILHDICEDTSISNISINDYFWNRVWFSVNALTKNKKPRNNKRLKEEYINKQGKLKITNLENYTTFDEYIDYRFHLYINRFYMWIIAEPWIFYIKISDQIHNLSTMAPFTKEKKKRKINEIEKFFMPIYIKSEEIFKMDTKTLKEYNIFMNLLNKELLKAKINFSL